MGFSAAQGAVISVSVDGVAASQRQIEGLNQTMGKLSQTIQGAMSSLAAGAGIGGGLAAVVDMSDQYSKLTSQLRLATDSTSAYAAAYSQVKRISAESQSDLSSTGVLYARISNGTKELGISQQRVAAITEVVNLALKVSAATTEESASAQLQLSQAFAAGALRGEDFNAVNEAAPRLMKALADGIGVPVGALKQMASEGKITSEVMAEVLPKSLEQLRGEATQVQTIGGAFTNLKNQVMEFTATSAQSNGTVALMTGGLGLLADNLQLVMGGLTTITAVKAATWAQTWVTATYQKITADQAARTATLASTQATIAAAEANLAGTQATAAQAVATEAAIGIARAEMATRLGQANATIASSEAAIAAATAAGVQSFALRTLRIATAELATAEAARSAALAELAVLGQQQVRVSAQIATARAAEAAATVAVAAASEGAAAGAGIASAALGLLGGPVGAVIAVLGVAATAWSVYGSKAEDANKQAADSAATSTPEIVANLEKQNEKLRERLTLMKAGPPTLAKDNGADAQQLASLLTQINGLVAQSNQLKAKGKELDAGDQAQLYALGLQYSNLTEAMQANKGLKAEIDASGTALTDLIAVRERLTGVDKQYLDDLTKLQTALEKGAIGQKEYTALVTQLATEEYKKSDSGKAALEASKKETEAYASLISGIRAKIETNKVELKVGQDATDSQKESAKLDQELTSGKLKLSSAHLAVARAALVSLGATEKQLKQADAERDLAKWITASADARKMSAASLQVEYALYGQSNDARDLALIKVRAEADAQKKLDDMLAAHKPITDQMRADLAAETAARVQVEQATMAQGKALQYAAQLRDENKSFGIDYIADDKARAAAQLKIDADLWQQRIQLAGDGTEAQKLLQQQYDTWYQNQLAKPELDANKKLWVGIEQAAHDTFLSITDGAKSAADRAKQALENGLFEWLYQMLAKPYILNLETSLGMSGITQAATAATGAPGSAAAGNPLLGAASAASGLYKAVSGGLESIGPSVADAVQAGLYKSGLSSNIASNGAFASGVGTAASMAGGYMIGSGLNSAISGQYSTGSGVMTVEKVATAVASYFGPQFGALAGAIGGLVNRAFGMGSTEVQSQGMSGTLTASSLTGTDYEKLHQDGGWFRSDKDWTTDTPFDTKTVAQFTQGLAAIEQASSGFAKNLGVDASWVSTYSKTFDVALTGDASKDAQAVTDFFSGIGDELATKLVPNLASFEKTGETASATLERLAGDFATTDQAAQLLGTSSLQLFGATGLASADARERLIGLAGGVSTLAQQAQYFSENFLTDAERIAPVSAALDTALGSLGLATIPTTRDEFKGLVDDLINSGAAATAAGAAQLESLLSLEEPFAQVHPQIDATAAAVNAAADALQAMQDAASGLLGDVDSAFTVLQNVAAREKAALQTRIDAETALIGKTQALSDALHGALDGMSAAGQGAADRAAAQAEIKSALASVRAGGALPDADTLKGALATISQQQGQFATYQDYLRDFYSTQNDIAGLAQASDGTLSTEQQTLDTLNAQSKQYDDMLASEQAMIDELKGQSSTLLSIDQAMQGVDSAILAARSNPLAASTSAIADAYQSALGRAPDAAGLAYYQNAVAGGASTSAVVGAITASPEAQIQSLYHTLLGRTADAAGLDYYLHSGESMSQIAADMKSSTEYKTLHPFAIGTNYIPEDMPALVHQGERIIPAADNRELMRRLASPTANSDALAEAVTALRKEVEGLRAEARATAGHTEKTSRLLKRAMRTGNTLSVSVEAP